MALIGAIIIGFFAKLSFFDFIRCPHSRHFFLYRMMQSIVAPRGSSTNTTRYMRFEHDFDSTRSDSSKLASFPALGRSLTFFTRSTPHVDV